VSLLSAFLPYFPSLVLSSYPVLSYLVLPNLICLIFFSLFRLLSILSFIYLSVPIPFNSYLNFLYSPFLCPLSSSLYIFYPLSLSFSNSPAVYCLPSFVRIFIDPITVENCNARTYAVVPSVFIHPIHFLTALSFARVAYIIKERHF
jgi:hypothetical protein